MLVCKMVLRLVLLLLLMLVLLVLLVLLLLVLLVLISQPMANGRITHSRILVVARVRVLILGFGGSTTRHDHKHQRALLERKRTL